MVAFAYSSEPQHKKPPRAQAQRSYVSSGAHRWAKSKTAHHLATDHQAEDARLVTCSKDPIGFIGGPNSYEYVRSRSLKSIDPSGLVEIVITDPWDTGSEYGIEPDWFVNTYHGIFGCSPSNYSKGCIGVVQDVAGKVNLGEGTTCFSFAGNDYGKAYQMANDFAKKMDCGCNKSPIFFAYRYWTNGKGAGGCPKCGTVGKPRFPPSAGPGAKGIPFDFCVLMKDGHWLGGTQAGGKIVVWPNLPRFATKYKNYDTTVVCVTCPGTGYSRGGPWGLSPSFGGCSDEELDEFGNLPRVLPIYPLK